MSTQTVAPPRKRSRLHPIWLGFMVLALAMLLVAIAFGWFYWQARKTLPQIDGVLRVNGLSAPVTVQRDAQGVPHIRAQNLADLLFAQGYVTAQDRLWQMDMTRRFAAGEMAEVLGADWIKHDRQQRILSIQQVAQKSAAQLDSASRDLFSHYAAGINAFTATHQNNLPLEFRLLHYKPRPWTLEDSFLAGANMAQFLSFDEFGQKMKRELITRKLGPTLAADLYPNSSWRDHPPSRELRAQPVDSSPADDDDDDADPPPLNVTQSFSPPRPSQSEDFFQALRPGSNNWVLSGAHTVSGKPLLSNDMHLDHQIPNVWYEAQLTAGNFNVAGVTLPGLPFVIAGHNQRIAWGFTNLGPDVVDIFIEQFNAQGEYLTPQGWRQPLRRHEVIHVNGGSDVQFDVLTTRHGPIVTELVEGETRNISAQWTLYDLGLSAPFQLIDSAQNWNEFRAAFSKFTAPSQNVVYADVEGNIGYQATGYVPIRASGDGALPVAGSDDAHDWKGYIPFDQLPRVYNPPSGVLATANGRVVPKNYPFPVSTDWGGPYRTERIYSVLKSGRKFSAPNMLELQTDIHSTFDQLCAEKFVEAVDRNPSASARLRSATEILRSWDGRMTKHSAAAAIETQARIRFLRMLLEPKLGDLWKQYEWYSSSVAVENLITRQPAAWLPRSFIPSMNCWLLHSKKRWMRAARRIILSIGDGAACIACIYRTPFTAKFQS